MLLKELMKHDLLLTTLLSVAFDSLVLIYRVGLSVFSNLSAVFFPAIVVMKLVRKYYHHYFRF